MILVTGASGLVGGEVARQLSGRVPLRLAVRDRGKLPPALAGEPTTALDFNDPATFDDALREVRQVFLVRPPKLARAQHDFAPFVAAMREAGVGQVVFLSVRGADRNPLLPHRGIERLLESSGLAWTHLRPNDFMQNFLSVHRDDIRDRGEIWAPAGEGLTSYVDVRDVAAAAATVLLEPDHERCAYTLTGAQALSLYEVATALSDATGRRIIYRNPGLVSFLRHAHRAGRPLPFALVMTAVYSIARLGLAEAISDDLPRLLGRPATAFAAFAADHARAWVPGESDGKAAEG